MEQYNNIQQLNNDIALESQIFQKLEKGMHQTIIGQEDLIRSLLIALLADGHILLEGVPGLAKTLAIKTLSQLVETNYSRIQFTPDLLPADVIGTMMYSQKNEDFIVKQGPIFSNFILADEINRAPAKVQSALLEAMQEHQVTIGDTSFSLPSPFLVMATQNPIEQEGTYPLPEAQLDRFMLKVCIDYPKRDEEQDIILLNLHNQASNISPIISIQDILRAKECVQKVYIDKKILKYIVDLVAATRYPNEFGLQEDNFIECGASPRASINLALASRAYAFLDGRGYVLPEDVRAICHAVLRHRIKMTYEAEANEISSDQIISQIINKVIVP